VDDPVAFVFDSLKLSAKRGQGLVRLFRISMSVQAGEQVHIPTERAFGGYDLPSALFSKTVAEQQNPHAQFDDM